VKPTIEHGRIPQLVVGEGAPPVEATSSVSSQRLAKRSSNEAAALARPGRRASIEAILTKPVRSLGFLMANGLRVGDEQTTNDDLRANECGQKSTTMWVGYGRPRRIKDAVGTVAVRDRHECDRRFHHAGGAIAGKEH
jgi:hypothetical protein